VSQRLRSLLLKKRPLLDDSRAGVALQRRFVDRLSRGQFRFLMIRHVLVDQGLFQADDIDVIDGENAAQHRADRDGDQMA